MTSCKVTDKYDKMYHTESISGNVLVMKNCDTRLWVFCVLIHLVCCSPDACCLMPVTPPWHIRSPTCFTVRSVNVSIDAVQPWVCLFPLTSVFLQPSSLFLAVVVAFPPDDCHLQKTTCSANSVTKQQWQVAQDRAVLLAGRQSCQSRMTVSSTSRT